MCVCVRERVIATMRKAEMEGKWALAYWFVLYKGWSCSFILRGGVQSVRALPRVPCHGGIQGAGVQVCQSVGQVSPSTEGGGGGVGRLVEPGIGDVWKSEGTGDTFLWKYPSGKASPCRPSSATFRCDPARRPGRPASSRLSDQCSQNVDVNGPHHKFFELIVSSSFNQPMAVERGRSHELAGSMVGSVYVHVLRTLSPTFPLYLSARGEGRRRIVGARCCARRSVCWWEEAEDSGGTLLRALVGMLVGENVSECTAEYSPSLCTMYDVRAFQSRKKAVKCDVIDFRLLHIVSKRGLRSDLAVVFWRFIFGSFQSRKKAVKCGALVFFKFLIRA